MDMTSRTAQFTSALTAAFADQGLDYADLDAREQHTAMALMYEFDEAYDTADDSARSIVEGFLEGEIDLWGPTSSDDDSQEG